MDPFYLSNVNEWVYLLHASYCTHMCQRRNFDVYIAHNLAVSEELSESEKCCMAQALAVECIEIILQLLLSNLVSILNARKFYKTKNLV